MAQGQVGGGMGLDAKMVTRDGARRKRYIDITLLQ